MKSENNHRKIIKKALLATLRAVSSTLDLDSVLDAVLGNLKYVVSYTSADVMIIDGDTLYIARAHGPLTDEWLKKLRFRIDGTANLRQVIETRKALIIDDTQHDPNWVVIPQTDWIRSVLSVPIVAEEKVIAILNVTSTQLHAFTPSDAEILEYFAANISFALRNARLYEAERHARERAEALAEASRVLSSTLSLEEVLQNILRQCERVIPYSRGGILAYSEVDHPVIAIAGFPEVTSELMDHIRYHFKESRRCKIVMETRQPLVIADTHQFEDTVPLADAEHQRAWIGVPLIVRGNLVGILKLGSEQVNAYSQADLETARAFADQAAIAIYNARLYKNEQTERALAVTLQETAKALASSLQFEATLNLIIQLLQNVVRYDAATIWLQQDGIVRLLASYGLQEPAATELRNPRAVLQTPFDRMMCRGETILVKDRETDARIPRSWCGISIPRSLIATPLVAKGQPIGVLALGTNQPDVFSQRDVEATAAFASQSAIAIENARLLTELENSLQNLRQAQTRLMHTARLSVAGEIAAGVAHQINNPLTTIMAHAHVLMQDVSPDSPAYDSIAAIQEAAHYTGRVVQRLMDFGRASPEVMEMLDINDSVLSAISLVRAQIEPGIARICLKLDPNLPEIVGTDERLQDVWINLLLNARDALIGKTDGLIHVMTRMGPDEKTIEVIVRDNGAGIPADTLDRVLEPFFTTKETGTGLGLWIGRDVITHHRGTLEIRSTEGVGTEIRVTLPLPKPAGMDNKQISWANGDNSGC
jgi:GAF domain-containing protein